MQSFTVQELTKFKELQNIKDKPGIIEKKLIEKTIKYSKYVKWIPGLKMLAIGNSVAMNSANDESDIDLFIITEQNRLWTVRILITLIFQILGVRKNNKHHKGRFCLSFFCTTNALNFEKIAIENDIYFYNWIIYLKPVLNFDNTYEKFIEENGKWIRLVDSILVDSGQYIKCEKQNLSNIEVNQKNNVMSNKQSLRDSSTSLGMTKKEEGKNIFLDTLEKLLKSIFLPKTKKTFEKLGKPFGVIINDDMLKFHDKDKRKKIRDKLFPIFSS